VIAASRALALVLAAAGLVATTRAALADDEAVKRGAYVFAAGGCFACHTDLQKEEPPLAGGPDLRTPFGIFRAPNITPDPVHGIGRWSDADFLRALRDGIAPDGRPYYPAFPFTTYSRANERDLLDLKAFLFAQPAVARPSRPHELRFPFSMRWLMWGWRWLNFAPAPIVPDPAKPAAMNRGAYLVGALTHCGECHTPRDWSGAAIRARWLAGAPFGADAFAPNLTPDSSGLASWKPSDIDYALEYGVTPDGEAFGGEMADVVKHSTSRLTAADRAAIAAYLKDLPPLPATPRR
jgi:mono/diheme cytochrome c family protein